MTDDFWDSTPKITRCLYMESLLWTPAWCFWFGLVWYFSSINPCLFCRFLPTPVKSVSGSPDTPSLFSPSPIYLFCLIKPCACIHTMCVPDDVITTSTFVSFAAGDVKQTLRFLNPLKAGTSANSSSKDPDTRDVFLKSIFSPCGIQTMLSRTF